MFFELKIILANTYFDTSEYYFVIEIIFISKNVYKLTLYFMKLIFLLF